MVPDHSDNVTQDQKNTDSTPDDELEGLLERLCLGELDPGGWHRLSHLIRGNRSAAKRYVEVAHYCETLRNETAGGGLEALPSVGDGTAAIKTTASSLASRLSHETNSLEKNHTAGHQPNCWHFLRAVPWGLAVCAAFACGWFVSTRPDSQVDRVAVSPLKLPPVLPNDKRVEPLGRVTGLTPVASSDGLLRSLKVGSQLGRGEVFQITSGVARLEIAGGEVLVEGPAELSAIDTRTVFVRQGRVSVRHPGEMTIQTPLAVVIGNAAEYAVVAEAESNATITAIEGEVVVDSAPERGHCNEAACRVDAGKTVRFSVTESNKVVLEHDTQRPDGLILAWEEVTKQLHDYERLVLSDEPLAYWPLNRVRRHRAVLDLTQHGFDGYAIGNWPTELVDIHASQKRGSYFDGESYVESDRKPPVDLRSGFTIESWARVTGGPGYQSVFTSRWVLASNTEQEQCFGFTLYAGMNDRWQIWTGSGAYGSNWDQLHAGTAVVRHEWTHVAASFEPDGDQQDATESIVGTVRLFVEGEKVAEARHTLSLVDFEWPARIGAAEFVPQSLTSWLFQGELRDVALYDHVLTPERIESHASQGRSAS